jgi:hypothetical protein
MFLIGAFVFEKSKMLPSNKDVVESPAFQKELAVPSNYPQYNRWIYSLDTLVPFLGLYQEKYWVPDSSKGRGLTGYLWAVIMLGWISSTLAAVALTGIIKKE